MIPTPMGTSAALSQGSGRASGQTDGFRPSVLPGPAQPQRLARVPRPAARAPRGAGVGARTEVKTKAGAEVRTRAEVRSRAGAEVRTKAAAGAEVGAGRAVTVPGSAVRWSPRTSRHAVAGTGRGRFSIAAAITSGNRSGVQANAGAPRAASAAACSRS